jgi:hypothetical protein
MRNLLLGVAAATSLFAVSALAASAQAASPATVVFGVDRAGGPITLTPAQYIYLGHSYCWYDAGWRGSGFYWCGYAMRRGYGWGGGEGWRGWNRGGRGGGGGRAGFNGARYGGHAATVGGARGRGAQAHTGGSTHGGGAHTAGGHAPDHK